MISDWGEVVTRYPYRKVRMDHLLSKEHFMKLSNQIIIRNIYFFLSLFIW